MSAIIKIVREVQGEKIMKHIAQEEGVREQLAKKYGIDRPDRINLFKVREYELQYKSPAAKLERFLDELEVERLKH